MADLVKLDRIGALAAPAKAGLLLARHAIHSSRDLQRLFDDAALEGWDVERLSAALGEAISRFLGQDVDPAVPRYLAEEFEARDKTQTLLVSTETGLAVAQVPSEALYQPERVPREGSAELAQPLMRLKPELEAAIIQHHHERGEEDGLMARLQIRARSSELQRADGDARFRITTPRGRRSLAEQLLAELPTLLQDQRGASGRLLSRCCVNEPVPESHRLRLSLTLSTKTWLLVADRLAHNFRYDAYRSARERIRAGWTRTMAKSIAIQAHLSRPPAHQGVDGALGEGLLIAEPNVIAMVRHVDTLLVPRAPAALVSGQVYLELQGEPRLAAYESEARWNLEASFDVALHLDPGAMQPLSFADVVESGVSVEVLR